MTKSEELLTKKEINGIDLEYLLSERDNRRADFLLVDVREEYEYNEKNIIGTDYLIPLSNFFNQVNQIEKHKNRHIVTTCKIGGRSAQAQMQLNRMGFQNVINLKGGISHYKGKTSP